MSTGTSGLSPHGEKAGANTDPQWSLLALTAALGTSQVTALTAFIAAIGAAAIGFQKLENSLDLSAPRCAALVTALLALLFFSHTLPILLDKRRKIKLGLITGATQPGYFQLSARVDEESFQRADGKHNEVFKWLKQPPGRVLYLTGSSGTGKSSLLTAWVLPKLEREGVKVIRLRGYQDPAQALEEKLKRPGVIWKRNPPETADLNTLFGQATEKLRPSKLLVVFDQFEEFLILQEEQQCSRFLKFLTTQADLNESPSAVLLVFRAEYDGFIQEMNLPPPIYGQNLQKVSAFTQRAAQDFLAGSGLRIESQLTGGVLREAAEVEEALGIIRPVTLNLCGLVLARFSTGLPHSFRPGRLIRGFVWEAIFDKKLREATPVFLRRLISDENTKKPCTIDELSEGTAYTARQAQGIMFKLSEPDRGIVHALDADYKVWEISHDFLVPMIGAMLLNWKVSLWRKMRPWLPVAYVSLFLILLFAAPRLVPDPLRQLNDLHWQTRSLDRKDLRDRELLKQGIKYELIFNGVPPRESARAMRRIPDSFLVRLKDIRSFDVAHFGPWKNLTRLAALDLSSNYTLSDISGLRDLPHSLIWLDISFNVITDSGLKDLPGSLKTLILRSMDRSISDFVLKNLHASPTSLELGGNITDAGLKDLPRSLTSLRLNHMGITDAGLKDLPRSLTSLEISDDYGITDAGLKDLPPSLTSLDLENDHEITDAGLKDLPRSLTSLDLGNNGRITDAGLKDLPRSLTSLDVYATEVTDAGLRTLPSSVKVWR
jgi:hypothetical protein